MTTTKATRNQGVLLRPSQLCRRSAHLRAGHERPLVIRFGVAAFVAAAARADGAAACGALQRRDLTHAARPCAAAAARPRPRAGGRRA